MLHVLQKKTVKCLIVLRASSFLLNLDFLWRSRKNVIFGLNMTMQRKNLTNSSLFLIYLWKSEKCFTLQNFIIWSQTKLKILLKETFKVLPEKALFTSNSKLAIRHWNTPKRGMYMPVIIQCFWTTIPSSLSFSTIPSSLLTSLVHSQTRWAHQLAS